MDRKTTSTSHFGQTVTIITDPEECKRMDEEEALMAQRQSSSASSPVKPQTSVPWQPPSCPLSSTFNPAQFRY